MPSSRLYVGNLNYSVTNDQLEELFSGHGKVKEVDVIGTKGFAFVEMDSAEEAEKVKTALNGTEFKGRTIRIDDAHPPKKEFRKGGGGGRGGFSGRR
jgi:RNA recognition motif-containing protein